MTLADDPTLKAWAKRGVKDAQHRVVKHDGYHLLEKEVEPDFWIEVDRIDEPSWYRVPQGALLWLSGVRQDRWEF